MEIKKGKLNYDQSGRAYPDKPNVKENWDCIWECNGKFYKLVGDDEHKEWEEVKVDTILGDKTSLVAQTLDGIELKQGTIEEAAEEFTKNHSIYPTAQDDTEYGFKHGAKWAQEEIKQFLYAEICERRPYSSSRMCEEVIKFIEQMDKK